MPETKPVIQGPEFINEENFHYTVIFPEERQPGDASVVLETMAHLQENYYPALTYATLSEVGLRDEDLVAYLAEFWPNGRMLTPEEVERYSRHGVGSDLLGKITQTCLEKGAKAIYTFTDKGGEKKESMRRFLDKQGFTQFKGERSYMAYFFKLF